MRFAALLLVLLAGCGSADETTTLEIDERPIPTDIPIVRKP